MKTTDITIQLVSLRRQNSHIPVEYTKVLGPIIGYACMPLVPLREACTPLTQIIPDILAYVSIAINDTQNIPPDGLTQDESASIRLYTMEWTNKRSSLYSILNHTLKTSDREDLKPWFQYLKLFLTALTRIPCEPSQTVWRGVKKHARDEFPPGSEMIWWAFSSCTTTLPVLESDLYLGNTGERTLFSIEVINGRNIRAHSQFNDEDEILLLPGTLIEVKSDFNPAPDLHVIHLKQKIPKEILLEPPFDGARLYPQIEYPWYRKKKFLIPLIVLTIISVVGIILGSIFGTRLRKSSVQSSLTKLGGYHGTIDGGILFDDFRELSLTLPDDRLVAITASWTPDMLGYIKFIYSNGREAKHGDQDGFLVSQPFEIFTLSREESISKVTGYVGVRNISNPSQPNGTTLVVGLCFDTSSLFGSSNGIKFLETYDNYGVAYVKGRAQGFIDAIQFMWLKLT